MRQCERLAELGMELAEAAQRQAVKDTIPPPPRRCPSAFPGYPDMPPIYAPRDTAFGLLFAQLSRCVRQAILLEARLAAGAYDEPPPARAPSTERAAPREPSPPQPHRHAPDDTPRLRPEQVEDDLTAISGRPVEDILAGIRAGLGVADDEPDPTGQKAPARSWPVPRAERVRGGTARKVRVDKSG